MKFLITVENTSSMEVEADNAEEAQQEAELLIANSVVWKKDTPDRIRIREDIMMRSTGWEITDIQDGRSEDEILALRLLRAAIERLHLRMIAHECEKILEEDANLAEQEFQDHLAERAFRLTDGLSAYGLPPLKEKE